MADEARTKTQLGNLPVSWPGPPRTSTGSEHMQREGDCVPALLGGPPRAPMRGAHSAGDFQTACIAWLFAANHETERECVVSLAPTTEAWPPSAPSASNTWESRRPRTSMPGIPLSAMCDPRATLRSGSATGRPTPGECDTAAHELAFPGPKSQLWHPPRILRVLGTEQQSKLVLCVRSSKHTPLGEEGMATMRTNGIVQ